MPGFGPRIHGFFHRQLEVKTWMACNPPYELYHGEAHLNPSRVNQFTPRDAWQLYDAMGTTSSGLVSLPRELYIVLTSKAFVDPVIAAKGPTALRQVIRAHRPSGSVT